jgi:hypothetical protein
VFDYYFDLPALKARRKIPFVWTLELYNQIALPRLADGPKTPAALNYRSTPCDTWSGLWYRAEDFPTPRASDDCATMTFEG